MRSLFQKPRQSWCPGCGKRHSPHANFCEHCGANLLMTITIATCLRALHHAPGETIETPDLLISYGGGR